MSHGPAKRKRKQVRLQGAKQVLQCSCPHCGHKKQIQVRRIKGRKWVFGVSELTSTAVAE